VRRRNFIKSLLGGGAVLAARPLDLQGLDLQDAARVKRVLVMFKCHLDVGFTDTQAGVMRQYFEHHYPRAIEVASAMRHLGEDRYVWTTGSWILYEYLEQANSEQRKRMDQAIAAGDVTWHALPFSWQTEMLDRSMITGALGLSQSLDRRYGHLTTGAKMTDVPGHSRGLIGPLAENGIKLVHIGVNGACTPPEVPALFVWKDPAGASLMMIYHHDYGGVVQVPGSDLALVIAMRGDNEGPHSLDELKKVYAELRNKFPNARVTASNLTEIAGAIGPYRDQLPVVTQEIGDTWIYGIPSDPVKVARYREVCRLRQEWIVKDQFHPGDPTDLALLRRLLLAAEHTWGVDVKTKIGNFDIYKPEDLAKALGKPGFQVAERSWAEKRQDIDAAVSTLPSALRAQANERIRRLQPTQLEHAGLESHKAGTEIETAHFVLALDPHSGAISRLRSKKTGRDWASPEQPLALFSYQTLSKEDFDRFIASYVTVKTWWVVQDLGKKNIEHFGARSRVWLPTLTACWSGNTAEGHRLLAELRMEDAESVRSGLVAWPEKLNLELLLPDQEPAVYINLSWFAKRATRLPEALWLSFVPQAPHPEAWILEKVDQDVSPFDVVRGGNRQMHAVTKGLRYQDAQARFAIETLDAPVVALGEKSPVYYSTDPPEMAKGIHFSLFNNAWGTNYVQWFGEDMRFRFVLRA
jgi:hypothetical protein